MASDGVVVGGAIMRSRGHVFRNAVDHGMRERAGKARGVGKVDVFTADGAGTRFEFSIGLDQLQVAA